MNHLHSLSVATPVGPFHLIFDSQYVVRAAGFGTLAELRKRLPDALAVVEIEKVATHPYEQRVDEYFAGDLDALTRIPYSQEGSAYSQSAWEAMSSIKPGRTASYKEIAAKTTSPLAIRAAGTACGQNRLVLIVPCHRVVKSDGTLGNYLYGTAVKKALLEHEARHAS